MPDSSTDNELKCAAHLVRHEEFKALLVGVVYALSESEAAGGGPDR